MAAVAPGSQVVEIEPQVRPLLDADLMICMQVPLAMVMLLAKVGEHLFGGWQTQAEMLELLHDRRFPTTIHAPPAVSDEA